MVRERPILFSAPMVRAILAGTKTQTRRDAKFIFHSNGDRPLLQTCPYGHRGDRLWVREAFDPIYGQSSPDRIIEVDYRADWEPNGKHWRMKDEMGLRRWKPSIHMPRDLSRILLEIVSVRVERLQDITDRDAFAEGVEKSSYGCHKHAPGGSGCMTGRDGYRALWDSINGPGSWAANPFVWVIEFKRVAQ